MSLNEREIWFNMKKNTLEKQVAYKLSDVITIFITILFKVCKRICFGRKSDRRRSMLGI